MKRIKKIMLSLAVLLCVFIGWWTAQDNAQEVTLQLLGFPVPSATLGTCLILALASGVVLGLVASAPALFGMRAEIRRLKRNQ